MAYEFAYRFYVKVYRFFDYSEVSAINSPFGLAVQGYRELKIMLLALPFLAGLLVGKLTGGSFRSLAATPLRAAWAIILALIVELALFTPVTDGQVWDIKYGHYVYIAALVILFTALAANLGRLRWPLPILLVGAALNLIVIAANGGAMPVDGHLLALAKGNGLVLRIIHHTIASNVAPLNAGTNLAILGDHIAMARNVYSIGDIFIALGGFLLVAAEMRREVSGGSRIFHLRGNDHATPATRHSAATIQTPRTT